METLLLTSAGMNVKEEILKILPKPANEIKIAHIITASKLEKDTSYVDKDKKAMTEQGFLVEEIDIEDKNEKELREMLKDKDVVYVQGGNTFYLLKHVRESGFDKVIKESIEKGKIYIGVSAGSIIAGPTIETAGWCDPDKNNIGLTDLVGLSLVPFLITVHYDLKDESVIKNEIENSKYPVRILTDDQAILVRGNKVELVGKGPEIRL